ncbi:MAG: hypothetical protein KGN76_07030 [Acidobacteriota bacterium]|nr:hypothetical protein [Acidobacteriota bacterium]
MMRLWTAILVCLLSSGTASVALAQTHDGRASGAATPAAEPALPPLPGFTILPPPTVWVESLEPSLDPAPRRPAALAPLYASLVGFQAMDLYTTAVGVRGGAVERNAIVGAFGPQGAGGIALKAASVAGTIYASERLWRHHPVRAVVLMTVVNCALAAVAANNLSVIRRH